MIDKPSIDSWLDLWEDLEEEQGSTPDEQAFLAKHCGSASPEMVEEFRRKLRRLKRMDARVEEAAAADTGGTAGADTDGGGGTPAGRRLRPGFEPVPGYVLVSKLGSGGFGQVWKATSSGGHEVALKFVRLGKRIGDRERRALDVMRHVRHPHLLSCHRSWEVGGCLIIATDLADRTLLDRLKEAVAEGHSGIPGLELFGYMEEAAKAIDFLNEPNHPAAGGRRIGIQHRDIKPENILLQGGGVKVADFGLARLVERSVSGHTGAMTAAYAAPEAFDGQVTAQSDQYSFAVTYCHLRGGRLPFGGSQLQQMKQRFEGTADLSMLPAAERAVVAKALARTPADRWPDCRTFVAAVRGTATGGAFGPLTAFPSREPVGLARRRVSMWIGLGVATVLAAVIASITLGLLRPPTRPSGDIGASSSTVPLDATRRTEQSAARPGTKTDLSRQSGTRDGVAHPAPTSPAASNRKDVDSGPRKQPPAPQLFLPQPPPQAPKIEVGDPVTGRREVIKQ